MWTPWNWNDQPGGVFTGFPTPGAAGHFTVTFNAPPGRSWQVETASDLKRWSRAGLVGWIEPGGYRRHRTDALAGETPLRFYRAVVE